MICYRTFSQYLSEIFPCKVQKVTLSIGTGCPNRDGTIGHGGCSYCNNASFSPNLGKIGLSVAEQIEAGKSFFRRKYPQMKYLAYFQSYTNTHRRDNSDILELYRQAMQVTDILGIVIGTRPDCISDELLDALRELENTEGKKIMFEYGAETTFNDTLQRINRCHTWETTVRAVEITRSRGFDVGLHFIMGLPGEDGNMMLESVRRLSKLDIQSVKFHQLQIIKGTPMAEEYLAHPDRFHIFSVDEYLDLCRRIISTIDPSIAIERFTSSAPAELVIAPKWGLKNYEFTHRLINGQ